MKKRAPISVVHKVSFTIRELGRAAARFPIREFPRSRSRGAPIILGLFVAFSLLDSWLLL